MSWIRDFVVPTIKNLICFSISIRSCRDFVTQNKIFLPYYELLSLIRNSASP